MNRKKFLELARKHAWIGVDFILRYNNPKWLGMSQVHKEMHETIDKVKQEIEDAKAGIKSWEEIKRIALIHVHRGVGKEQPIFCRVLTPDGWKCIGDIKIGDIVYDINGKPTKVVGVYPQGWKPYYKITTESGRITYSGLDHLWAIYRPPYTKNKLVIKTLKEILAQPIKNKRFDPRTGSNYEEYYNFLPAIKPIEFPKRELPIDPYTLGVWLGDGHTNSAHITTADEEILEHIDVDVTKCKQKYIYYLRNFRHKLHENNLLGNKHILDIYLFSSIEQRLELLRGILDTDGYVYGNGTGFEFINKNKKLIDGVVFLVRSLGGKCRITRRITRYNGKEFSSFRLFGTLPNYLNPFKLSRKAGLWKGKDEWKLKDAITDIEYVGKYESVCIAVDSDTEIYITDDFIPTHNTTQLLGRLLWEIGTNPNHKIKIVCETDDNARKRIIFIQQQILENKHLHLLFPHLKPAQNGLWNNLQLYVERDAIMVDPSVEGCGILGSSTGSRATIIFCFDALTECFTRNRGWISGVDLKEDDELLVYDKNTKQLRFEKPKNIIKYKPPNGAHTRITTDHIVQIVTTNHKCPLIINGEIRDIPAVHVPYIIDKVEGVPVSGYKISDTSENYIYIKCEHPIYRKSTIFNKIDLAWLTGLICAVQINHNYRIRYFPIELVKLSDYHKRKLIQILEKYKINYTINDGFCIIDDVLFREYIIDVRKNGLVNNDKTSWFRNANIKVMAAFIDGFDVKEEFKKTNQLHVMYYTYKGEEYIKLAKYALINPNIIYETLQLAALYSGMYVKRFPNRETFLELVPSDVYKPKKKASNIETGYHGLFWCVTTSTGYLVVRRRKNVYISGNCDDPIGMKNSIIYPENSRKAEEAFFSNWIPMLEDDGFVVMAYTVWTENDFPYKLEQNSKKCFILKRVVDDDLNPVWPEKFPKEKLKSILDDIGPTAFARGYQGKPASSQDYLFNKDKILESISDTHYLGDKLSGGEVSTFIGVDLAISQKRGGKRTAIVVIQVTPNGKRHIIDIVADKLTSIETANTIISLARRYNPLAIYVENNAYQQALIEWLEVIDSQKITTGLVHGYYTGAQKFDPNRGVPALASEFEKGLWEIHKPVDEHEYNPDCDCPVCLAIKEFITFPHGKTSDIVMATFFAREAFKDVIGIDSNCDIKFISFEED